MRTKKTHILFFFIALCIICFDIGSYASSVSEIEETASAAATVSSWAIANEDVTGTVIPDSIREGTILNDMIPDGVIVEPVFDEETEQTSSGQEDEIQKSAADYAEKIEIKEIIPAKNKIPQNDSETVTVEVNGFDVFFPDQQPNIIDERTFIPIRFVMEELQARVDWIEETNAVSISRGETSLIVQIGNTWLYANNGVNVKMDVAPIMLSDRTLVPIRFIAEALGSEVQWEEESNKVIIRDDYQGETNSSDEFAIFNPLADLNKASVPYLLNMPQNQAQTVLNEAGLKLQVVEEQFSDTIPAGNIITQTPAADRIVDKDSVVSVRISKGRPDPLTISEMSINVPERQTHKLDARSGDTSMNISWTSSNNNIATVSANGMVTGVRRGTCTITASNGIQSASCIVTVDPESIAVNRIDFLQFPNANYMPNTLNSGEIFQCRYSLSPNNATDSAVVWSSSNTNVATVDQNGVITARAIGNSIIRVAMQSNSYIEASFTLNVVMTQGQGSGTGYTQQFGQVLNAGLASEIDFWY